MSQETVETPTPSPEVQSPEPSADLKEAKNTRDVLVGFRYAIEVGQYPGKQAMSIAKGLAFLDAIIMQNDAHVKALEAKGETLQ